MTAVIEDVFRVEYGRVVATLIRQTGDVGLAEECAQDAFTEAVQRWPSAGTPPNPGAWLTTTARNRAIDRLRRESTRDARHREATAMIVDDPPSPTGPVTDDRLRLMFTCCHPALGEPAQIALTLRLLGGLTVTEIAAAFLVPERTMAQRITRAKAKLGANHVRYRVPSAADLPARLSPVLAAIYLVFNEGYLSASGDHAVRVDLCAEAIRLGRLLTALLPDEPEIQGLLALMLLTEARRPARTDDHGVLVALGEQDRSRWDAELIAEGHAIVRECLRVNSPGPYQLLAAVNAVHTDASDAARADWAQIAALYDQLYAISPTPVVALNRAVARAEVDGAQAGLVGVDALTDLAGYHALHAARADLLRRSGRPDEARAAYERAIELAANPAEIAYLTARRDALTGPGD